MKVGLDVQGLAQLVNTNREMKRDLIVSTNKTEYDINDEGSLIVHVQNSQEPDISIKPSKLFLSQVCSRLKIGQKYFDRMKEEAPNLLADNIRYWSHNAPERRMLRTFKGTKLYDVGRAYLSDGYKRLENEDVLVQIIPALAQVPGLRIVDSQVTDNRLYIKAITPRIEGEIKKGDRVQAGAIISNSEVGCGSLNVTPLVYRCVCDNGMIIEDRKFRAYHIGRRADEADENYELITDETKAVDDKAILLKARDIAYGIFNQDYFNKLLIPMREASEDKIETVRLDKAVEVLSSGYGLNNNEQMDVLQHLIRDNDLTRWGLANAVTRAAQDVDSFDRSVELEGLGSQIVNLARKDWKVISQAE
jgi:hypothetical protein